MHKKPDRSRSRSDVANDERETELIFTIAILTRQNTVAEGALADGATWEDQALMSGKLVYTGDADHGIWSAGQVQGLIHDIPSCAELVSRIMREAEAIIESRLEGMMSGNRREAAE